MGVWEMMREKHFQMWMAKPPNGCVEPQEASALWHATVNAPEAIIDHLGRNPRYARRVAIKKADYAKSADIWQKRKALQVNGAREEQSHSG